jgi:toxin ParE1/3/4
LSGSIETSLTDLKEEHRYVIRGNYKIIYKIQHKNVFITDIFDIRQDPEKIIRSNESDLTLNEPNE